MKKSIIALAVAACISSSLIPGALAVDTTTPTFTITRDGGYSVKPGQEITYTVSLRDAVGIEQIGSIIEYDKDVLTYLSSEVSMDYSYSTTQEYIVPAGKTVQASISFSGKYNVTNSKVYSVTFKVNDDAEGMYYSPVTLKSGKNGVTYYGGSTSTQGSVNNNNYYIRYLYVGDNASLSINSDKYEAVCGDDITYTVSFPEEFQADGVDINISYPDNLEFTGKESLMSGLQIDKTDSGIRMLWLSTDGNKTFSGDAAKLTFKAIKRGRADVYVASSSTYTVAEKDYEIGFNTDWNGIFVYGSTEINITTDKTEAVNGDKIHVSVTAANAADIEGLAFTLRFDNTVFKLADAPDNNVVPTKVGTAYCDEEGNIQYKFIAASSANYLNGDTELMSFDLIATGSGDGSDIYFNETESLPDGIVEFNGSSYIYVYPEDDAEIVSVQELINAIPEVTADNYSTDEVTDAVAAAERGYNLLSNVKKEKIDTKKLDDAKELIAGFTEAADKAAAVAVQELVDALEVTEENWQDAPESIAAIETAYDALTDGAKAMVTDYDDTVANAKAEYEKYAQAAADKAAADKAAADVAVGYIDAIGDVTENSGSAIAMAENVYNNLTDDQKALVPEEEIEKLTNARAAYDEIIAAKEKAAADKAAADDVAALISALSVDDVDFAEKADAAEKAYEALTDDQKALVPNYAYIEQKLADYAALKDIVVTVRKVGGSYIVTANERKPIDAHQTVIAVAYKADGTVANTAFTTSDNGEAVVTGATVKTFVWDSAEGMKPYASVETVEK